ncbi:hypothetical protein AAG570_005112 [Ranatra chinensis]|uniref:Uncharacterized protein n=1 Tax=Ranatra chinensis TaxID=642074 RepID=A0ABD0Y136_9HEMI
MTSKCQNMFSDVGLVISSSYRATASHNHFQGVSPVGGSLNKSHGKTATIDSPKHFFLVEHVLAHRRHLRLERLRNASMRRVGGRWWRSWLVGVVVGGGALFWLYYGLDLVVVGWSIAPSASSSSSSSLSLGGYGDPSGLLSRLRSRQSLDSPPEEVAPPPVPFPPAPSRPHPCLAAATAHVDTIQQFAKFDFQGVSLEHDSTRGALLCIIRHCCIRCPKIALVKKGRRCSSGGEGKAVISAESSGVDRVVLNGGSNVSFPMVEASSGNICTLRSRGCCL